MDNKSEIRVDESRIRPSKSEVTKLIGDSSLANSIGWTPNFTFEDGLSETINWFRNNLQEYSQSIGKYER